MSSKIEKYKEAKRVAEKLTRDVTLCLGRDSQNNDKHHVSASYISLAPHNFAPMIIHINLHHGYYGSSSAYSNSSNEMGAYLAKVITNNLPILLDAAVFLAKQEVEKARQAAEQEAKEILGELD